MRWLMRRRQLLYTAPASASFVAPTAPWLACLHASLHHPYLPCLSPISGPSAS